MLRLLTLLRWQHLTNVRARGPGYLLFNQIALPFHSIPIDGWEHDGFTNLNSCIYLRPFAFQPIWDFSLLFFTRYFSLRCFAHCFLAPSSSKKRIQSLSIFKSYLKLNRSIPKLYRENFIRNRTHLVVIYIQLLLYVQKKENTTKNMRLRVSLMYFLMVVSRLLVIIILWPHWNVLITIPKKFSMTNKYSDRHFDYKSQLVEPPLFFAHNKIAQ